MMKHAKAVFLTLIAIGLILALTLRQVFLVEADPVGGTFAIPWWTVDNGGGNSSGPTFGVRGTIGQPDAGQLSGSTYGIYGGFWGPLAATTPSDQYLPFILNNVTFCYSGAQEIEPNNTRTEATGPLCDGQTYQGAPNDQKDYFTFVTKSVGNIVIDLTGHAGTGVQMQLFYQNETTPRAFDTNPGPDFHIAYNGPAGQYYIYIFTASGYPATLLYNLIVNYP